MLNWADCEYYQAIKDYSTIMVFGASVHGWDEQRYCKFLKKDISCYLVCDSKKAGSIIHDVPVRRIDDVSPEEKQKGLVIVGRAYEHHLETVQLLREHGFCHIIPGVSQNTLELSEDQNAELRKVFGDDLVLQIPSLEEEKKCNVKIYAVTSVSNFHKANCCWDSKYIEYIQAGAALTKERICALTDDAGENVSQYNHYINEGTAGYWIAKNDNEHKYVGLFHYSRGMDLSDRQIEWIAEHNIDVVLKTPNVFVYDMLSFSADTAYKVIYRYAPDYVDAARYHLKSRFFFQGSIQIAKREIFREYYEWAFHILKGAGEMFPSEVLGGNKRFCAYLMESLMNIWYIKNADRFRFAFAPDLTLFEYDSAALEKLDIEQRKLEERN